MIFNECKLKGAFIIELEKKEDERGFFSRTWDKKKIEDCGLNSRIVQSNISYNKKKGTLRGLHYQTKPYEETKLVRCSKGSVFDVIIDLRSDSKTFRKWISVELTDKNYKMIYIPEGFAHGFQSLEDNTEVFYQMSEYFNSDYARGIRWDDAALKIKWPLKPTAISRKDLSYEPLEK